MGILKVKLDGSCYIRNVFLSLGIFKKKLILENIVCVLSNLFFFSFLNLKLSTSRVVTDLNLECTRLTFAVCWVPLLRYSYQKILQSAIIMQMHVLELLCPILLTESERYYS